MYKTLYDDGAGVTVKIALNDVVRLSVGSHVLFLMSEELADIADAVAQYLSAAEEPFFTEEDLEAGRQAIAEYL